MEVIQVRCNVAQVVGGSIRLAVAVAEAVAAINAALGEFKKLNS